MINQPNSGDRVLKGISTEELIRRCDEERRHFVQTQEGDAGHCYEIYRRAYQENDNMAAEVVLEDLRTMARHHKLTALLLSHSIEIDDIAQDIFIRGKKLLNHFEEFKDYPSIRKFLGSRSSNRNVTNSVIVNSYLKLVTKLEELPFDEIVDDGYPSNVAQALDNEEFWDIVRDICTTEEVLLLKLFYVGGLKPREIAEIEQTQWETGQQVSKTLYRIHSKLQDNNDRFDDFRS